jgi:bacterioferritin (cytochrome b1)
MTTKELQQSIVSNMQHWQKIENAAVASTGRVLEKTNNPVVRLVMEVIQRDSMMHHRVQDMIASSLSAADQAVSLAPEELAEVWGLVEEHIALERKTVDLAKEALAAVKGKHMVVQEYLLNYLLIDEEKHNALLDNLEGVKRGMYPYG